MLILWHYVTAPWGTEKKRAIMKNKQEMWTTMILSGYSKKLCMPISEAIRQLLSSDCINYLEEYYETLHLLSNEDVICELIDMCGLKA